MNGIGKFFNGKKTAIGAIISLGTAYAISKGWIGDSEQIFFLGVSTLFVGGGIGHKIKKAMNK